MSKEYVEKRAGGYYISGGRVALDSIVYAFSSGDSPESIQEAFPVLSLEEVYGAIAFYLAHREEVEATLVENEQELERLRSIAREKNPLLYRKLEEARRAMQLHKQQ